MSGSVLLVEDNDLTRATLRDPLVAEGFAVLEARDGAAARERVSQGGLDLVLLDLVLRDTDGLALARELRGLPGARGVPFVAVSGFLSRASAAAMMASFEDVVTKPVEARRLLQVVRGFVSSGAGGAPQAGHGRHVLVVDDDPVQAKLTRLVLTRAGFRVSLARGGEEALELAAREPPDLILSDVLMPEMDGFRLCQAARSDPKFARIPVVLVSASYVERADEELAGRMGASALVLKTPGLEGALAAVVSSLERAPPRPASPAPETSDPVYTERVLRQLDRHISQAVGLAQRCSTQAAMLSVVSSLTEAWTSGAGLEETLGRMLRGALEIGGVSRGAVFVRRGAGLALGAVCGYGAVDRRSLEALAGSAPLAGLLAPGGPTELIQDAPGDDGSAPSGRVVLVPLLSGEERHGVLLVACNGGLLDDEWRAFVRALGAQVGQAIALDAARTRLTFSEERYRALMQNARDGIFVLSPAGVILEVSRGAEELIGVPRAELMGRDLRVFRQDDPRGVSELLERVLAEGVSRIENVVVRARGGGRRTIDVSGQLVEVGDERVLLVLTHDVTERRRAEEEMRLLHTVALAAAAADDLEETLRVVLREACRATGWAFGSAWVPRPGGAKLECVCAWAELPHDRAEFEASVRSLSLGRGEGSPGRAWDRGEPALSALPATGLPVGWREVVTRHGLGAGVSVPVVVDGEVVAVITLHSGESSELDTHQVELVKALVSQVGAVVRRRATEEALRRKEEELRQAQKLEAIGLLAGGIAHDFNNILSVILGDCAFALQALEASHPAARDIEEIRECAERAAALTRQVLAFSRRQVLAPRVLDLNASVREVETLLRRVLGEDVELALLLAPDLWPVRADPGQLEQILLNLSVNARDAMPGGGRLTLATRNEEGGGHREVQLEVSDDGEGMDPAVAARVFEPFFTTKEPGKGTGLGLATVHGIVEQSGGTVRVHSERGVGTTFLVRLPAVDAEPEAPEERRSPRALDGTETVLVVDDDARVRGVAVKALEARGYRVLAAGSPEEALALERTHAGELHLVLSDVVIPGMSGPEVTARLRERRPGLRVLFMSGFAEHAALRAALLAGAGFVQKPFTPQALAAAVRGALDA